MYKRRVWGGGGKLKSVKGLIKVDANATGNNEIYIFIKNTQPNSNYKLRKRMAERRQI